MVTPDLARPIRTYADDECYMWCKLPPLFGGTPEDKKREDEVRTDFGRCLNHYNKDHNIRDWCRVWEPMSSPWIRVKVGQGILE